MLYSTFQHNHTMKNISRKTDAFLILSLAPILVNLLFFILGRLYEGIMLSRHHFLEKLWIDIGFAVVIDLPDFAVVSLFAILVMLVLRVFGERTSLLGGLGCVFIFHLLHLPILHFFILSFTPLDRLVFAHSWQEIATTVQTVGIDFHLFIFGLLFFTLLFWVTAWLIVQLSKRITHKNSYHPKRIMVVVLALFALGLAFNSQSLASPDYKRQMIYLHKSMFFYQEAYRHFFENESNPFSTLPREEQVKKYQTLFPFHQYVCTDYPFLTRRNKHNPLGPLFPESDTPPSVVVIIVEGLGNDFLDSTNPVVLMPFLDSLKRQSIYWDHFLGVGERSYAVLPALSGSLPHGEIGFSMLPDMPLHLTLFNQLAAEGYQTGFYYGQGGYFHQKYDFLLRNHIDIFIDKSSYGDEFNKIFDPHSNYHWGYHDQDLFKNYFKSRKAKKHAPRLDVFFTGTMHPPYIIDQEDYYDEKYEKLLNSTHLTTHQRDYYQRYKRFLRTLLFTDDALQKFFNEFSEKEEFSNTIFIITGDHPMTEIPIENLLKRYHVPLIIYSPMLLQSRVISSISSQFDVMPAVVNLLEQNYGVSFGDFGNMFGTPLDTTSAFSSRAVAPFMRGNRTIDEIVYNDYFLSGKKLFRINPDFDLEQIVDPRAYQSLSDLLNAYNQANNIVIETGKLLPDNLFASHTGMKIMGDTIVKHTFCDQTEFYNLLQLSSEKDSAKPLYCFVRGKVSQFTGDKLPVLVFELRDKNQKIVNWKPAGLQAFLKMRSKRNSKYFNHFITLDPDFFAPSHDELKVFLWNENRLEMELTHLEIKFFIPE